MKNFKLGFTLVELLVAVTILAIISVVAYTSYSGLTERTLKTRKEQDVGTIESAMAQYFLKNNNYPLVGESSDSNLWGYSVSSDAFSGNTVDLNGCRDGNEITCIKGASGGGKVNNGNGTQIGAKGAFLQSSIGKEYLSKDLYDPQVGDISVTDGTKFIDKGIGRYVYAVLNRNSDWSNNSNGTAYNLAYTLKDDNGDIIAKVVGDYTPKSCGTDANICPETLIGPGGSTKDVIKDGEKGPHNVPYLLDY